MIITILDDSVCNYVKDYLIGIGVGIDKIIRINFSDLCVNKVFDIS